MNLVLGVSLCGAWLLGCDAGPGCVDQDLDGAGRGCAAGPDCDDTNPLRVANCDRLPAPDCTDAPFATGCPCLGNLTRACYPDAPPATEGVGPCKAGFQRCVSGFWNLCRQAVLPGTETCDDTDQDCDGAIDEGTESPCGGCDASCVGGVWGEAEAPFVASPGLAITARGRLTLARETRTTAAVWVANSAEGTVSRIDAAAAGETGRYQSGGSEPSRVAVDWLGDAWVANRAFEDVPTLRKIAGDPSRCVDRDDSGAIDTSDGPDIVADDECVLLTIPVGDVGTVARAIAIDGSRGLDDAHGGDVWVGLHEGEEIVHLDGATGAVRDRLSVPEFAPYAAAFDPWGMLWMISRDGLLVRVDRRERPLVAEVIEVPMACYLLYGLAIDREGRLVLTGFGCDQVLAYDPEVRAWSRVATPPSVRGAVFDGDAAWVAHTDGRASRLTLAPLRLRETIDLRGEGVAPIESIGVGADGIGHVWVVSSAGGPDDRGVATRVDAESGVVTAQVFVGRAPHTQGDLTGQKLHGAFVPEASATHVFDGCARGGTAWRRIHVASFAGSGGRVRVEARHASDASMLASAPWRVLGVVPDDLSPYSLAPDAFPEGGVVEVRLTLSTTQRDGAPRVERVGVEWRCPGPE